MKKFKTKGELKAVSLGDFGGGGYKCDICLREFVLESELTAHEIQHMKLTCGICNKNFKSKSAFDEHEMNHPKTDKMVESKSGYVCGVCKKKFKTATQLSYHELYHSDQEIQQAREEDLKESKDISLTATPKVMSKPKPMSSPWEGKGGGSNHHAVIQTTGGKPPSKDSKSKITSSTAEAKKTASPKAAEARDRGTIAASTLFTQILKSKNSHGSRPEKTTGPRVAYSESEESEEDRRKKSASAAKMPSAKVKPVSAAATPAGAEKQGIDKKNRKSQSENKVSGHLPVAQDNAKGLKTKISCEKCKKKFSDAMTLEYHKITFHVTESAAKPKSKQNDRFGRSMPKSREFVDESSDSEREGEKSPAKRKQESPKVQLKKFKRDPSSSDESPPTKKPDPKLARRVLAHKPAPASSSSDEEDEEGPQPRRVFHKTVRKEVFKTTLSPVKGPSNLSTSSKQLQRLANAKKAEGVSNAKKAEGVSNAKKADVPPNAKKSDGLSNAKKADRLSNAKKADGISNSKKAEGRSNTKTAAEISVRTAEIEIRQSFISPKNEKTPCNQCGRYFANGTVLSYHEIRCTGDSKRTSRKLSLDSNRTLSTDSRASLDSDPKVNTARAPETKPTPIQPTKTFKKTSKPRVTDSSSEEEDEEEEEEKEKVKPKKIMTARPKYSSSSSEGEEEEKDKRPVKLEKVPEPKSPADSADKFKSKFSAKGFTEVPPANLYREKLFTSKGVKVKCEYCGKSFKNTSVLDHHNIYCNVPKVDKGKSKPKVDKLDLTKTFDIYPADVIRTPTTSDDLRSPPPKETSVKRPTDYVERNIIRNRSSQSPVDLILKKLTGGVTNQAYLSTGGGDSLNSSCEDAANNSYDDAARNSSDDRMKNQKTAVTKNPFDFAEKDSESERSDEDLPPVKRPPVLPESEGQIEPSKPPADDKQTPADDKQTENRMSIYTSSEEENGDEHTSDSGNRRPAMHPNARHGVEILEEEMKRKKRAKKEKKAKKAKKKAKKARKRRSSSESDSEDERKSKKKKKKKRSRFAVDKSESESTNSSNEHDESEQPVSPLPTSKTTKKKKNPNYCLCDKPETMEMIGCDYCDMWYHPECLGLDDEQTLKLTETTSWMCPECIDNTDVKGGRGKNGGESSAARKLKASKGTDSDSDY